MSDADADIDKIIARMRRNYTHEQKEQFGIVATKCGKFYLIHCNCSGVPIFDDYDHCNYDVTKCHCGNCYTIAMVLTGFVRYYRQQHEKAFLCNAQYDGNSNYLTKFFTRYDFVANVRLCTIGAKMWHFITQSGIGYAPQTIDGWCQNVRKL